MTGGTSPRLTSAALPGELNALLVTARRLSPRLRSPETRCSCRCCHGYKFHCKIPDVPAKMCAQGAVL
eukprot:2672864-Alexandrium_andersonii.AAC.1